MAGTLAVLAAVLPGCAALDLAQRSAGSAPEQVQYRPLADIPPAPAPLTTPQERQEAVDSLEADRARVAQAQDSLRRQAESETFLTPSTPGP